MDPANQPCAGNGPSWPVSGFVWTAVHVPKPGPFSWIGQTESTRRQSCCFWLAENRGNKTVQIQLTVKKVLQVQRNRTMRIYGYLTNRSKNEGKKQRIVKSVPWFHSHVRAVYLFSFFFFSFVSWCFCWFHQSPLFYTELLQNCPIIRSHLQSSPFRSHWL